MDFLDETGTRYQLTEAVEAPAAAQKAPVWPWVVGGLALAGGLAWMASSSHWKVNPIRGEEIENSLEYFYPETASGRLRPQRGERIFRSRGPSGSIGFIGDKDGRMIPIEAQYLSLTEGNIFTPQKIDSLVEEASKREILVYPGYGDVSLESDGHLHGHMRDGNHRVSAAIELGAPIVWILLSDSTKQQLDEAGLGHVHGAYHKSLSKLYKAIRKAQKAHGAPLFQWKVPSKIRVSPSEFDDLVAAESQMIDLDRSLDMAYKNRLKSMGFLKKPYFSEAEQLQRAATFDRMRINELREEHGREWVFENVLFSKESEVIRILLQERNALVERLHTLRTNAGLDPRTEHVDPTTKKVFRRF